MVKAKEKPVKNIGEKKQKIYKIKGQKFIYQINENWIFILGL